MPVIQGLRERRFTLENPNTPLSAAGSWLAGVLGGQKTVAGVPVNADRALDISAVWAALRVVANTVAVPSFPVYERLERGKRKADLHPLTNVLDVEPNPEMSAIQYRRAAMGHLAFYGNHFAEKEFDNGGEVIALWPLLPDRTHAERHGGRKVIVTEIDGQDEVLPADRVFHIPGDHGWDGLNGRGMIQHARESFGLSMATERFGASWFGNGARPSGALKHPKTLTKPAQERLKEQMTVAHSGLDQAHRLMVLEEGLDWMAFSISPEDSQFLETRKFQVTEVARWLGVAPHLIYDLEKATYSNIEQQHIAHFVLGSLPWYRTWEQEVNRQLFPKSERNRFFAEILHEELLRADSEARGKFYWAMFQMAALSPNEIRERENMNPVEGGDEYFVQQNLMTLENAAIGVIAPAPNTATDIADAGRAISVAIREQRQRRSLESRHRLHKTQERLIRDVASRMVTREVKALTHAAEKAFGERDTKDFRAEMEKFYEGMPELLQQAFFPTFRSFAELVQAEVAAELGNAPDVSAALDRFIARYVEVFARRYTRAGRNQLRKILDTVPPGEHKQAILERLEAWGQTRADKVAMVESTRAGGAFARAAYMVAGILTLRWVTVGKTCKFCQSLAGRTASISNGFVQRGEAIEGEEGQTIRPFQTLRHPPIHRGCDCMIVSA